jgi:hypothetical protein
MELLASATMIASLNRLFICGPLAQIKAKGEQKTEDNS